MMSVDPLGREGAAAYYLEVIAGGVEDYYLAPGEAPGRWLGPAAEAVGLRGAVRPEDLESLLAGNDPRTGAHVATWLTRPGYDLTLSAPKSVSLLWALGDDRVAAVVREAHDEAVDAAMGYLDREGCKADARRWGLGAGVELGTAPQRRPPLTTMRWWTCWDDPLGAGLGQAGGC